MIPSPNHSTTPDELIDLLDTSAPPVTFACPDPWYTIERHQLKSKGRCLQLTVDRDMHYNHLLNHRHAISRAKIAYYTLSLELLKKTHTYY